MGKKMTPVTVRAFSVNKGFLKQASIYQKWTIDGLKASTKVHGWVRGITVLGFDSMWDYLLVEDQGKFTLLCFNSENLMDIETASGLVIPQIYVV